MTSFIRSKGSCNLSSTLDLSTAMSASKQDAPNQDSSAAVGIASSSTKQDATNLNSTVSGISESVNIA